MEYRQRVVTEEVRVERRVYFRKGILSWVRTSNYKSAQQPLKGFKQEIATIWFLFL